MSQTMNITDAGFQISSLALAEDEVQLWRADLEEIQSHESHWQKLLSADERARAERFHFDRDRQRFVAARALLRTILAAFLRTDPATLKFSYSKTEKPLLAPAHDNSGVMFNVSHSGGVALYAFSRRREVGVDVEQVRRDLKVEPLARRFFSAFEQRQLFALPEEDRNEAFFRCWTRKEAYIKAVGEGLSIPLSQFDVSLDTVETNALLATRPDRAEAGKWMLRQVPAGEGYRAALCVRGRDWKLKQWC